MAVQETKDHIARVANDRDELAWTSMLRFFQDHYERMAEGRTQHISELVSGLRPDAEAVQRLRAIESKLQPAQQEMIGAMNALLAGSEEQDELYVHYDRLKLEHASKMARLKTKIEEAKLSAAIRRKAVLEEAKKIAEG